MMSSELEYRLTALRDSLSGQTLSGSDGRRYPLGARLGEGGQGWIFRATWNGSVDVVVKVLRPDAVTPDALARFQREAVVLRTLSHQAAPNPHIVRYYDHASATLAVPGTNETWTFPFTVLEYVQGETLALTLLREAGAGLGLERTRRILRHIVLALRDVHAHNIIHRDLKPSNVLIDTTNAREIAKVTDFGLAKVFDDSLHRTTALAGATVGYAPPEQFERGNPRVVKATDVFSLAAIFFELVTGEACFPFSDPLLVLHSLLQGNRPTFASLEKRLPRELRQRPDVVAALDVVLSRALESSPEARYATVTLFHDALEDVLSRLPTGATLRLSERPMLLASDRVSVSSPGGEAVSGDGMTLLADGDGLSEPPPAHPAGVSPSALPMQWQLMSPPVWPRPLRAIAVSPDARGAFGIGVDGLGLWIRHTWTRVDLPRFVAPATIEALAWFGNHILVAGASPTVHLRSPEGHYFPFEFNVPGLVFHGIHTDAFGAVLVGEQFSHAGSAAVVATMTLRPGNVFTLGCVVAPGVAPLRAVTRIEEAVIACGDRGTIAALVDGGLQARQVCDTTLFALAPSGDGAAMAVGGGGFVFRVTPSLGAELEAVQTTRALTVVTRGPDGSLYAGGEDRRVLRRGNGATWVRDGATAGTPGTTVRALAAARGHVRVFLDDGSVLEGESVGRGSGSMPAVRP